MNAQLPLLASLPPPPIVSQVDAVTWLNSLQPESVDLAITDCAYESLEKHRAKGTTTRLKVSDGSSNPWFDIFPNRRFPALFAGFYRVLKRDAHLYFFCDSETMFVAKPIAEDAGFKFWKPIVWNKVGGIGLGYHYRGKHEFILFFEKGKRRLNDLGIPDVLDFPRVRNGYPTQKPDELCEVLVKQSSEPGDLVIDPFMGACPVGVAALKNGRRFAGTDISDSAVKLASERLGKAVE